MQIGSNSTCKENYTLPMMRNLQEWVMQSELHSSNEMPRSTVLVNPSSAFGFVTPLTNFQNPLWSVKSAIHRLRDITDIS